MSKVTQYKALLKLWNYDYKSKLSMDIYEELQRMWTDFSEADLDEWEAGYA